MAANKNGFSMVELLVVIGIIAVLIAILMPTLTRVRAASQLLVCQFNLHQIFQASVMFAADHQGYIQIAGKMNGTSATPADMDDPQKTRYVYFEDDGAPRPAPLPVALAPYLGSKIRLDSRDQLVAGWGDTACVARRVFTCSSQMDVPFGQTVSGDLDGWDGPKLQISYAYNEAVTGWVENSDRRLHGKFSKVHPASEIIFMSDAIPRTGDGGSDYIAWFPNDAGRYTLADAYSDETYLRSQFDEFRHQGRINVVYFDGHVQFLWIAPEDLQRAMLVAQ
jgi:prepilin-type processing-associated H-X9-DG protein/prepilin-type N-terminal cleavage/methylation domain-containing protein